MRQSAPAPLVLLALLLASEAQAHIKLLTPTEWIVTDATYGDPQKQGPCGVAPGTAGVTYVDGGTTVVAGSTLTVTWRETILHPGHFRLAITADRATLLDPAFTAPGGVCGTATVQSPPVAPVVADGLFEHTSASADGTWTTTVTVPAQPCEHCTLQLLQFMSQHGAPCFYYHCAELRIVASDGGTGSVPDAGTPPETDAGVLAPDAGASPEADAGVPTPDAGATPETDAGVPTPDAGASADGGVTAPGRGVSGGCVAAGWGLAPLLGLLALGALRRRRA
jgi:hypothetical protein